MINKKIIKIYNRRQKAHDELLACDIELDKILKTQKKEMISRINREPGLAITLNNDVLLSKKNIIKLIKNEA